jgi:hypothetical protein
LVVDAESEENYNYYLKKFPTLFAQRGFRAPRPKPILDMNDIPDSVRALSLVCRCIPKPLVKLFFHIIYLLLYF